MECGKKKKSMYFPRVLPFGCYVKKRIYIFGGYNLINQEKQPLLIGESYHVSANEWSPLRGKLPDKKFYLALPILAKDLNSMYVFTSNNPFQNCAQYLFESDKWHTLE